MNKLRKQILRKMFPEFI